MSFHDNYFKKQHKYFRDNYENIKKSYLGMFVAISDERIVDSDYDNFVLDSRLYVRADLKNPAVIIQVDDTQFSRDLLNIERIMDMLNDSED